MPRLELSGGYYTARSSIAGSQRCVNLYPERNSEDAPSRFTDYPTPGLELLSSGLGAPLRGAFTTSREQLFIVEGQSLQYVNSNWVRIPIGTLAVDATTPVSMQDNGETLVVVDGSPHGYTVNLASFAFGEIADAAFYGADKIGYLDTFFVYNRPATQAFYVGPSNAVVPFDPLAITAKTGYPDLVATLEVLHREVWVLGAQRTSEIWGSAGTTPFPLAIVGGVFIEEGCGARYSVAKHDLAVFWLGTDAAGARTIFKGQNYAARRISTPAIASALRRMSRVDDAIGMTYKQEDHVFYMLMFPTADRTLVWDDSESLWHERAWTDANGIEHRHRASCAAYAYGENVCGDWENGNLYRVALDRFTDNGDPIVRRRGFPRVSNDGKLLEVNRSALDLAAGESSVTGLDDAGAFDANLTPRMTLRWSTTKGRSWSDPIELEAGVQGDFEQQPFARQLGVARQFDFEVSWSLDADIALNGAWADITLGSA